MKPRSIPWGSKQKRKYQSASQRYERKFQGIESRGMSQRILRRRVASGEDEETRRRNRRDHPENETTRRKGKRQAKAVVTVERQEHTSRPKLPSIRTTVFKVCKYNHYASCCRIGAQPQEGSKKTKRERIKKITEDEETSSDSDDDCIYLQETAQHLHRVKMIRSGPNQDTVLIRIGDIDAFVEPDSGASANVMDEYQLKALKYRSQKIKELEPSRDTLKTLQSDQTVKGEFTATLRNKNRGTQSKFLVIQRKMDSPRLLSKSTLLELGMLNIDPERTLKETNELRIKTVKTPDDSIETVLSEYSDVFQGIGCFRWMNTSKKIEVNLEIAETDANLGLRNYALYRITYRNHLKIGWTREWERRYSRKFQMERR